MSKIYRIHFGYSKKSKYYWQAIELARLSDKHEVLGEGDNTWHIVTLTDKQIDLMASLYLIAIKVPLPKIYGADIQYTYAYCLSDGTYNNSYISDLYKKRVYTAVERLQKETGKSIKDLAVYLQEEYLRPIERDMSRVAERLRNESYIDSVNPITKTWERAKNKPQEPVDIYKQIREFIVTGEYSDAVSIYYQSIGNNHNNELLREIIYLKRLANIALSGRDLLYFRNQSSREGIIELNLDEYVNCIDEMLSYLKETGRELPLDILRKYAPTMEEVINGRKHEWHMGVYLWSGEFKRDSTPVTLDTFSAKYDNCPEGRLFDRYPDQVRFCRIVEYPFNPRYTGLWVTYSPSYYQTEILDKGLHLNGIEAYQHKSWRDYRGKWRKDIDFMSLQSVDGILKMDYATSGIEYTGRTHQIGNQIFFEINLVRNNLEEGREVGNPFLDLVEEILKEAENRLREKKGLPRIGEGWVSETRLYRLVQSVFPDAEQHAMPQWLRPQHLDVFVPSRKIAFEYQGRQHFEPIDFFGGQESFESTIKRDKLKAQKCNVNGIILIEWLYTEPIDHLTLVEKLKRVDISPYAVQIYASNTCTTRTTPVGQLEVLGASRTRSVVPEHTAWP